MGFARFAFQVFLGLTVVDVTAGPGRAYGSNTICSEEVSKEYRYGTKDSMKFMSPGQDPDALPDAIKDFAEANSFSYWTVGSINPAKEPEFQSLTHILQTQSVDISIEITTTNRSPVAEASVATFSHSCSATEDWQPYWHAFVEFVTRHGYQIVP